MCGCVQGVQTSHPGAHTTRTVTVAGTNEVYVYHTDAVPPRYTGSPVSRLAACVELVPGISDAASAKLSLAGGTGGGVGQVFSTQRPTELTASARVTNPAPPPTPGARQASTGNI
jgi:hypothetical protein